MEASAKARDALTLIFLATTIISAGVAAISTNHYVEFFPAMQQLRLGISSFTFSPTNTSLGAVVSFAILNPSSYTGIGVTDFVTNFTVQAPGNNIIPQGVVNFNFKPASLDPQKTVTVSIPITGSGNGPYYVHQLLSQYTTAQFRFNFTSTVFLSTFLQNYATVQTDYECTTTVNVGSCAEVGVLLKTHPGPGTSAGGG